MKGNTVNVSCPIDAGGGLRISVIQQSQRTQPVVIEPGNVATFYLGEGDRLTVQRQADVDKRVLQALESQQEVDADDLGL